MENKNNKNNKNIPAVSSFSWDEIESKYSTEQEIELSDRYVEIVGKLLKARELKIINQKKLNRLIAAMDEISEVFCLLEYEQEHNKKL